MMSAVRQARIYVLPLWAVSLGLGPESITLIVGIAGGLEFLLFYASGQIMDRWGRLLVTLPPMLIMGGAFLALSFTHDLPDAVPAFVIAAVVIGGTGLNLLAIGEHRRGAGVHQVRHARHQGQPRQAGDARTGGSRRR